VNTVWGNVKNGRNGPAYAKATAGRQNGEGDDNRLGKALSSGAAERVYGRHSGYRNLKAYQVAELVYD
jgi:hypothetical protein